MRAPVIGAAVAVAALGCAPFENPPPLHVFPVRQYELPSGLRVAVEEEPTSGMAGIAWVIDAGALDDPPAAPGLSHLVEHLVLRAPEGGSTPLERRLAALGADSNGITSLDRTTFFAFVASSSLDAALALMAGRLAAPLGTADDALVAKERGVTAEEMRLRRGIGSMVGRRAALAALNAPGQPFFRLGDFDGEIRAPVTLADARTFAARHYRPNRMTLVICGPVSPADDQRLLAALPAALRGLDQERHLPIRRALIPPSLAPPPPGAIPSQKANVASPELWMAWLLPPARGLTAVPFEVLGRVAEHVVGVRLDEGQLPDVLATDCSVENSALGGALLCRFVLRPKADRAAVKKSAGEIIARLDMLGDHVLSNNAQTTTWSVHGIALTSALGVEGLGRRLSIRANLAHEDPSTPLSSVLDSIQRITPWQLGEIADRYLGEELGRAVLLVPDKDAAGRTPDRTSGTAVPPARPADPAHGSEEAAEDDAAASDDDLTPTGNLLDVARAPGAGAALTTRLASGLTVIALRRPGLPFASLVLGFHAEPQPQDAPGVGLAAMHGRHHFNIQSPLQRGVRRDISRGPDRYEDTVSMFSSQLEQGFRLLDDETRRLSVRWPAPSFDRWLELATLASGTPAERAQSAFATTLWNGHPYTGVTRREQLRQITSQQIVTWLRRVRRPANGALVIVGDIDPATASREAAESLADWTADATPPPPPPPPPVAVSRAALPVLVTADPQGEHVEIHFGCFLPPVRTFKDEIAGDVFLELMREDLLKKLRYQLGASYSIGVGAEALRGGTYYLDGHVDAKASAIDPVLGIVRGWLETSGPLPGEPALARARWRVARKSARGGWTNASLARWLFRAWNAGLPLASLDGLPQDLAGTTLADVAAVLGACRASAVVSVLGAEAPAAPHP